MKKYFFSWLFFIASLASTTMVVAQVDRIELGYQTTKRGIVWYRPGLPTHTPTWQFSRDTNAVLWADTLTAIRYDWDYSDDRWRAKGTFSGPLPPRPEQTSGAALIDNRTGFWIRDTFNLLHKYDSTANAWTPLGDFFFLPSVPTDIAATGSNGAAKYTRSLWQNSATFQVRYWDGDSWEPFTAGGAGDDWGAQVAETDATIDGDGTIANPLKIEQQGATLGEVLKWNGSTWRPEPDTDTDTDAQSLTITGASSPYTVDISGGTDVNIAAGTGISLSETPANTLVITNAAPEQTVTITNGGGIAVTGSHPAFTLTASDQSPTNEGTLGVGAGSGTSSTLVSNTSGANAVTINAAGIITISETTSANGGSITLTATEGDASTTNELQTLANTSTTTTHTATLSNSGGSIQLAEGTGIALATTGTTLNGIVTVSSTITQANGSETIVTAGTGISVSGTGTSGTPYIVSNTGDLSATNEAWTVDADDADTELITNQTVKFEGAGGITTDYNPGTNVVLITGSPSTDGNGIYGDGTATSGNDTLPTGGSTVTIPGQWQPLQFNANTGAGQVWSALVVNAATCTDDRVTKYLVGKSPSDSLEIYGYDCGSLVKATGGQLTLQTDKELINIGDSIYMATVPDKTTLGGIVGFTQFGSYLSQIKGTATDQVLKWNNTGSGYWYPGTDASGTITGAENGLSVVSNKIRLGGNLITAATSIEGDGNELRFFDGKLSVSSWTGFANTPVQPIRFQGAEADPTLNSTPTLDGIIEYRVHSAAGSDQSNSMTIGAYSTDADGVWMQSRSASVPNVKYPLSLQPRGGLFSVGRVGGLDALATFAGSALAGSTITGNVMHLENTGGNAKAAMGMGVGTDVLDSEIGFFDAADALRITNRNATTGTSSVRIAVGGEASDKVIIVSSSVTPSARMGVGHTATTTVKSTIDNKGSFATANTQTTGNLTLTEAHHTVRYTLNSSPTFTLPTAGDCPGREYLIHHFGSAGNIILSQNVISSTGTLFNTIPARNWAYIYSDGVDWYGYRLQSL